MESDSFHETTSSTCSDEDRALVLGVCGMSKKTRSSSMRRLLNSVVKYGEGRIVVDVFEEEVILGLSVDRWPQCDVLLAFYADGFPLEKARQYIRNWPRMRVLCDVSMQERMLDRRNVAVMLRDAGIPAPASIFVNRDSWGERNGGRRHRWTVNATDSVQGQDWVHFFGVDDPALEGCSMRRPFVEKPVSAEDHRVSVYYPGTSGVRNLFRKRGDCSSSLSAGPGTIRTDGSYIYEEFLPSEESQDVKVYAVGQELFYAESRKAPTVDGEVERDAAGKERRYPVTLRPSEIKMVSEVQRIFGQFVCGMDILRCKDSQMSYVIDVNGLSLVKNNMEYSLKAGEIIAREILHPSAER